MGDGSKAKGREGPLARNCAPGGREGCVSVATAAVNELEATAVTTTTAKGDRSQLIGELVSIGRWDGHPTE